MPAYAFTVILADQTEITEDLAEALVEAGCDDASPRSSEGIVAIDFDRDAESLERAIRFAIADAQKAGCRVARVEIEAEALPTGGTP
jgi:hypothetical protein